MHRSKTLTLVVLAALLLSACSSAATPTIRPATQAQATATERPATSVPTKTTAAAPTSTEPGPAATATRKSEEATATQKTPSATDTPAPAISPFLEVGPDEWVHGPADAPVTIIEYADFQ